MSQQRSAQNQADQHIRIVQNLVWVLGAYAVKSQRARPTIATACTNFLAGLPRQRSIRVSVISMQDLQRDAETMHYRNGSGMT